MSRGRILCITGVLLVVIDQVIKILVMNKMEPGQQIDVLSWFKLCYVENVGMAYGLKFGGMVGKLLLSLFRIALVTILLCWIWKLLHRGTEEGSEASVVPMGVLVGLMFITAGAVGNIIDSLYNGPFLLGKVVDMFQFPLFHWPDWVPLLGGRLFFEPVFNFADACVTCGAIYLVLFHWKFFSGK
ncbi:MAG: signal peptidase II [Bacteroidales bacterium]|nr:signal peptidase II [Bacteroidales bacterium]